VEVRVKDGKNRVSRALKRSYKTISALKDENKNLGENKKNKTQKRLSKIQAKTVNLQTHRSKTYHILKKLGIDLKSVPDIRKHLLYNECLNEEVLIAVNDHPSRKKDCLEI